MKNREVFTRDPAIARLMNNGQARLDEMATLREELSNFVCEGQYASGLLRILESYVDSLSGSSQPAAWVSGFYGSGKSHLLKMLVHLWVNTEFPDGSTARGLVPALPPDIEAALRQLDIQGKRRGGLRAAWGSLPTGGGPAVRLIVLGTVLRAMGLPEGYAQARFCLYLRRHGFLDAVKSAVEKKGKDFAREINNLYVSPVLHDAVLQADQGFRDRAQVRALLEKEFPRKEDISSGELLEIVREVLESEKGLPCTLIVLDEVQLFIGDSSERATQVVEVAEVLSKQLEGRVLLVGAGQTALSNTPQLQKLRARFTIPVELSDADVEVVTRRVLLEKRPDAVEAVREALEASAGEIDRQLVGTRVAPRPEDRSVLVDDYPLLPARRRFWELVLRAVDPAGEHSQLRTQLKIVYEALRVLAEEPLGTVVPADFIFDQIQPDLQRRDLILREIGETIRSLEDGTERGRLAKRLCGLIFLIRKLPREGGADAGVRATSPMLADLLVSDLRRDGARIRELAPAVLKDLAEKGMLLDVDGEYSLQTRESAEWEKDFRARVGRYAGRDHDVHAQREGLLREALEKALGGVKIQHGKCKEARRLDPHFGEEEPRPSDDVVQVWVRDEWSSSEKDVLDAARAAGPESPRLFVFVPKAHADELRTRLIGALAAEETLEHRGAPTSDSGREARDAMETRMKGEAGKRDEILGEVVAGAKVFKGAGVEVHGASLEEKTREAAGGALGRLFPRFRDADHKNWKLAIDRARRGDDSPLQAVDWPGPIEGHQVAAEVLREIGGGRDGRSLRERFRKSPYGWPQDAVDAALIALHAAGQVEVRHKGSPLPPRQLDQGKISLSDFRRVTVVLTAEEKLRLRGLFQAAGIDARAEDDLTARAVEYLRQIEKLAESAGGEPPLPPRPSTELLEKIRAVGGQEQLAMILAESEKLLTLHGRSKAAAELAERRLAIWKDIQRLLAHGASLPEVVSLQVQADALRAGRQLLDGADRVTPLRKQAASALRSAVKAAHEAWKAAHEQERQRMESDPSWTRIAASDRAAILAEEGLGAIAAPQIGTEAQLLACLDGIPLSSWREKTDALPRRFANAALRSAQLLEPNTREVRLTSGVLKTPDDVKAWIAETEAYLMEKVGDGPIVVA